MSFKMVKMYAEIVTDWMRSIHYTYNARIDPFYSKFMLILKTGLSVFGMLQSVQLWRQNYGEYSS